MVSTQALEALLAGEKLFPEAFGLLPKTPEVKQRISVNASVLAMGYQRFIPNFAGLRFDRSEEHTSELQSLMRISYAVFCLQKKIQQHHNIPHSYHTQHKYITTQSH